MLGIAENRLAKKPPRRPRIDAARNRVLLLEAAKAVFSAGGAEVSLEAVAKTAGVGIGTLYRHFPTRQALFEAVYRHEVDELGTLAEQLRGEASPAEAMRRWLHALVAFGAAKKGMATALAVAMYSSELSAYSSERLTRALSSLLERGVAAGALRKDVDAQDLLRAVVGMGYLNDHADGRATMIRMVDVLVDGLAFVRTG